MEFKNKMNGEIFHCQDHRMIELIDGIEYILVQRPNNDRKFLMRKDVLEKIAVKKTKIKGVKT